MLIESPIFAIPTPFQTDGSVDEIALREHIAFLHTKGVSTIVAGGTTGEFSSLDLAERIRVFQIARKHFPGAVVSHVSACSPRDVVHLCQRSEGADALLVLPPYYFAEVSDAGLADFFEEALLGSSHPVFLYNFPKHTKIRLSPGLVSEVCQRCDNILGIKDSGGAMEKALEFKAVNKHLRVFVGSDKLALKVLAAGLDGSITGASNPFPEFLVALSSAWRAGEREQASEYQDRFDIWNRFRSTLHAEEVSLVKLAINCRLPDYPTRVRAPHVELSREANQQLLDFIRDHADGWLPEARRTAEGLTPERSPTGA